MRVTGKNIRLHGFEASAAAGSFPSHAAEGGAAHIFGNPFFTLLKITLLKTKKHVQRAKHDLFALSATPNAGRDLSGVRTPASTQAGKLTK